MGSQAVTELGAITATIRQNSTFALVRRSADRYAEREAIVFEERTWTYAELVEAVHGAAGAMAEAGVGSGDRVAALARNSDMYVIGWLATQLLGAIHVPINFMLNAAEVGYIVEHSGASLALADEEHYGTLVEAVSSRDVDPKLCVLDSETDPAGGFAFRPAWRHLDVDPAAGPSSSDIAQIAYTSGTEAAPKGAMLSHEALISQYVSCIVAGDFNDRDLSLHALPLYHCAQMHVFLMPALYLGASAVILSHADIPLLISTMKEREITSAFAPPTVWIGLLQDAGFNRDNLPALQKAYTGAASMPEQTIRDLHERLPGLRLWNFYGQTEIAPVATYLPPEEQLSRLGSAGRAALNVETRVVDDEMRDVAPGEVGEVVHRSPQVMCGYYDAPEVTARAFEGGWFHSGDLARLDEDGYITIVDRKKDMINTGGENVSSREVEEVLYEHPEIAELAIIGLPHEKWIETVCAVIVQRDGGTLSAEDVDAFARERLAPYKVPRVVHFVDELPKNPSGKILKRELRLSYAEAR